MPRSQNANFSLATEKIVWGLSLKILSNRTIYIRILPVCPRRPESSVTRQQRHGGQ